MIKILIRIAIAYGAIVLIPYSTVFHHVDVLVPSVCVPGVGQQMVPAPGSCEYKNVTLRGNIISRRRIVAASNGAWAEIEHGNMLTPTEESGFTWRSFALFLVAICMWLPSLISLFFSRKRA